MRFLLILFFILCNCCNLISQVSHAEGQVNLNPFNLKRGMDLFDLFSVDARAHPYLGINFSNNHGYLSDFYLPDLKSFSSIIPYAEDYRFISRLNFMTILMNHPVNKTGLNYTLGFMISMNHKENEYFFNINKTDNRSVKGLYFQKNGFRMVIPFNSSNTNLLTGFKTYCLNGYYKYNTGIHGSWINRLSFRIDNQVFFSSDVFTLKKPANNRYWLSFGTGYTHNTTKTTKNAVPAGLCWNITGEYFQEICSEFSNLIFFSTSVVHYLKICRRLYLANRFAMSTSLGNNKSLFYIGGVQNAVPVRKKIQPEFIPLSEISVDPETKYAFQTVPAMLRGFPYNTRNGSSYVVTNNELRWSFLKGVVSSKLATALFDDLQVIGFVDAGSAWSGSDPFAKDNEYDFSLLRRNQIAMKIDMERSPVLMGIGFGVADRILGHYIRIDWAWGIEKKMIPGHALYLSFNTDF